MGAQRKEAVCTSSQLFGWQMQNSEADLWTLGSAMVNLSAWVDCAHLSLGHVHGYSEQINWGEDTLYIWVAPPHGGSSWIKKSKGESQWPIRIHGSLLHDGNISDRCLVRLTSPSLTTNHNKSFSFTVLLAIVTTEWLSQSCSQHTDFRVHSIVDIRKLFWGARQMGAGSRPLCQEGRPPGRTHKPPWWLQGIKEGNQCNNNNNNKRQQTALSSHRSSRWVAFITSLLHRWERFSNFDKYSFPKLCPFIMYWKFHNTQLDSDIQTKKHKVEFLKKPSIGLEKWLSG